jgi:multidrug efflux pump subunit AcrA (membrane-fusion protein)
MENKTEGTTSETLYAGKFKTVEDLESGYKNAAKVYDDNEALKTQLAKATEVPHDYVNPADVEVDPARVEDIKARAKEAGLNQSQYEKFVRSDKSRLDARNQAYEANKKAVGEETLNILTDYVTRNYPKPIQDAMIKTFVGNKEAREAALGHRSQLLNSQVPGVNKTPPAVGFRVTQDDINKAYAAKEANKASLQARQHYLNLLSAKAEQDKAS